MFSLTTLLAEGESTQEREEREEQEERSRQVRKQKQRAEEAANTARTAVEHNEREPEEEPAWSKMGYADPAGFANDGWDD